MIEMKSESIYRIDLIKKYFIVYVGIINFHWKMNENVPFGNMYQIIPSINREENYDLTLNDIIFLINLYLYFFFYF